MLADYFEYVYTADDRNFPRDSTFNIHNTNIEIHDIDITQNDIYNTIKNLDIKKGMGPDQIPVLLLKSCNANFTPILHKLFTNSLKEGLLPSIWKQSYIKPINKSHNRSHVENYRPISITSVIPKILESIITNSLVY